MPISHWFSACPPRSGLAWALSLAPGLAAAPAMAQQGSLAFDDGSTNANGLGNNEVITIPVVPRDGPYYMKLVGRKAYAQVSLQARY